MAEKKMTDKERLDVVLRAVDKWPCPARGWDECKPGGCFGGSVTCSFHQMLDPEMLAARERREERAEVRNLRFLRAENKALKERIASIQALLATPIEVVPEKE